MVMIKLLQGWAFIDVVILRILMVKSLKREYEKWNE